MNMKRILGPAAVVGLGAGVILAATTITPGVPTRTADEAISITIETNGVQQTLTAWTGNPRSSQSADDIQKTLASKLQKISDAINFGPQTGNRLTASVSGGTISVTADSAADKITKISITNSTNQALNKLSIGGLTGSDSLTAVVWLGGPGYGVDDDDNAATVTIGTARGTATLATASYASTEALVAEAVRTLVNEGVAASVEPNTHTAVLITMSPTLDEWLEYGCTDVGLSQVATLSVR